MGLTADALGRLVEELHRRAQGAWVQRIHQPSPSVLVFHLYGARQAHVLVVDTLPSRLALGLLNDRLPPNPPRAPAFCMLLRKHLEGARLAGARTVPGDRVALLHFRRAAGPDAMLAVELTGRSANVVLVVDDKVVGFLRAPGPGRALGPGEAYAPPSPSAPSPDPRGAGGPSAKPATGPGTPPGAVSLERVGSEWLARYERELHESARRRLLRRVSEAAARLQRRLERQEEDLRQAEAAEQYRRFGELLLSFQHAVPPGASRVVLPPPDQPTGDPPQAIPLDPSLPPAQNAAEYFRRYRKARRAVSFLEQAVARARQQLASLRTLEVLAREADGPAALRALEAEADALVAEAGATPAPAAQGPGPDREGAGAGGKGAVPRATPAASSHPAKARRGDGLPVDVYRSSDGVEILVGRSARANDHVTFHLARADHLWLHARGLPGAHVVVRAEADRVTPRTLEEAAMLAARFSAQGRSGVPVPVDYTRRRHVRKPPGAPPGFVVYDHEKTVTVLPRADVPGQAGRGA